MRSWARGAVLGLVLLAAATADARDPVVPGLEMDAVAKPVVEAWRAEVARPRAHLAEAPVLFRPARRPGGPAIVQGTYRFDLVQGAIEWRHAARGRMFEQAWWRLQLDWLLREFDVAFYLAHSRLRGETTPTGTRVHVTGRSPFTLLQFDGKGDLVGLRAKLPGPGGAVQEVRVQLRHERVGKLVLLTRYVMDAQGPGGQALKESGSIEWAWVRGRALPRRFVLALEQGPERVDLVLDLGPWWLGDETLAKADAVANRALTRWESRTHALGRLGIATARCDVELERADDVQRGTYAWDGTRGRATWQDGALGGRLGPAWHTTLDQALGRFPLRRSLGASELIGTRRDGRTVVRVEDSLGPGGAARIERLVFGADGNLEEILRVRSDGARGTLRPTWQRITYPERHVLGGTLRYLLPTRWSGSWTRQDGSTFTSTKRVRYVVVAGVHVPSRIEIGVAGGRRPTVFRLRNWALTRVPLVPPR